ncbi:hypothetical protein AB1Y20_005481 [Prymnesium parvum]|uniref:Holocytochrome c-type synthase n=1 Tax=Prymnesium parvum TaxID=97485 RepID=A0AB34J3H3_PRYPA
MSATSCPSAAVETKPQPCPVGGARAPPSSCPVSSDGTPPACPARSAEVLQQAANGCGAPLNPSNAMPATPNQAPAAGQRRPLPTRRVESTIPNGDTSDGPNWMYPSEQMFYNAMRRKGFDPREEDMKAVVAIHNTVNERVWHHIMEWEALHPECTEKRKLLRFQGNADDPTMKARARMMMGYNAPFDRHDWVLDRCGKEVNYLIDFYQGKQQSGKPVAMHIDARPAGDDLSGVWDRIRLPFIKLWRAGREED